MSWKREKKNKPSNSPALKGRVILLTYVKLFVGNLPFNVNSPTLAALFEKGGNVEIVEVINDQTSGRSRGFGFVTMSSVGEAEAVVQQLNRYELQDREIGVNSGPPPPEIILHSAKDLEDGRGRVEIIPIGCMLVTVHGVLAILLETLFSEQETLKEAMVVYDKESGRSRGFEFVTYSSLEEVNNVPLKHWMA